MSSRTASLLIFIAMYEQKKSTIDKKKLAKCCKLIYITISISGEMAEWSKATVSKIVILLVGIEGSNPSLSAIFLLPTDS